MAHVVDLPYAGQVAEQIERSRAELARVAEDGASAVDPTGITLQEAVRLLRERGPSTLPRLARELHLPLAVVQSYAKAMRRRGLIAPLRANRRGVPFTRLMEGWEGKLAAWVGEGSCPRPQARERAPAEPKPPYQPPVRPVGAGVGLRKCAVCGSRFEANVHGRPQVHCSRPCAARMAYQRKLERRRGGSC